MKRYAIVRGARDREEAEAYLPDNYKIEAELVEVGDVLLVRADEMNLRPRSGETAKDTVDRVTSAAHANTVYLIEGKDVDGWTLDGYVIPRYASGSMACNEIDLSHPVMKSVPV